MGRVAHDFVITWFRNGMALAVDDSHIDNTFTAGGGGRTEFRFPVVRRSDEGLYRVELISRVGAGEEEPVFTSQQQVTFQINVTGIQTYWP
jgi:hypothetical protein